jgi:UDP-2,3-diacylglucosamine pyrophosphatase LpxH
MAKTIPWTTAETALLRQYVEQGLNAEEISQRFAADGLSRTHQAVRRYLQRLRDREPGKWCAKVALSPIAMPTGPLEAEGDTLVLGDPHCPFHDADWVNRVSALALRYHIKQVALIGDLIDWTAFSRYGRRAGVEAEDEIRAAEQFVRALAANFERVYYLPGNHEERLARQTNHALTLERIAEWWVTRPNVVTTRKKWMLLHSGGETFRLTHPKNYSRTPGANSRALCSKYLMHTIGAHDHLVAVTKDVSGTFWGVDTGMCAARRLLDYIEEESSNNPQMVQGACLVMDGVPVAVTPDSIALYESMTRAKAA